MLNIQNKKTNKWTLALIAAVLLIGTCIGIAYYLKLWPFAANLNDTKNDNGSFINYSAPTEEEVQDSQNGKKNSADIKDSSTENSSGMRTISVDISYAGKSTDRSNFEIRAFTPDVIEGNGTCTATLTNGAETITTESKGFIDATSTICEPLTIPYSKLSSGTWKLSVTYSSPSAEGASESQDVTI